MEDPIILYFQDLHRKNRKKSLITMIVVLVVMLVLFVFCMVCKPCDMIVNLVASGVTIIAAFVLYKVLEFWRQKYEDENKVSYRNSDMWNQYGTNYRNIFRMNDSDFVVYSEKLFLYDEKTTNLVIEDRPGDFFELDPYIKVHSSPLLEAHAKSKKTDSVTVRLKDFEGPSAKNRNKTIIRTERSSYLAHLLTNRALDYLIDGDLSIRKLFENDKSLRPPKRAQLSNHFGVNALVFLKEQDDKHAWLLLPHRSKTATVAKNKVTASIASRLEMDLKDKDDKMRFEYGYDSPLTKEYIIKGCVEQSLEKICVPEEWLNDNNISVQIDFLGLSRDIYEGGKPTLFYAVELGITPQQYMEGRGVWDEKKKKEKQQEEAEKSPFRLPKPDRSIDEVEKIHIVKWSLIKMQSIIDEETNNPIDPHSESYYDTRLDKAKLMIYEWDGQDAKDGKYQVKEPAVEVEFEQNLISNFWFLEGCPEPAPSAKEAC